MGGVPGALQGLGFYFSHEWLLWGFWLLQPPLTFCFFQFYLFLAVLDLRCRTGSSLLQRVGLCACRGAPAPERSGFRGCGAWAPWLQVPGSSAGSVAEAHGLSFSRACGAFPDQGLNLCLLRWNMDS